MADFDARPIGLVPGEGEIGIGATTALLIAAAPPAPSLTLDVVGAAQYARNAVDVGYSHEPYAANPFAVRDALRLANYAFADAGGVALAQRPQHAERVGPGVIRVLFDADLPELAEGLTVTVSNVEAPPSLLLSAGTATFATFATRPRAQRAERAVEELRRDLYSGPDGAALEATGDLANEEGAAYLRKRILRRFTNAAGAFALLGDGYGLAPALKATIRPATLRRLQARGLAQVREEPDVVGASVRVRQSSPGVALIQIRATSATATAEVGIRATLGPAGFVFEGI